MRSWCSLFFLLSSFSVIVQAKDLHQIAHHPQWLKLLHYKKSLWGASSTLSNQLFFLSPKGHWDPLAELRASLLILRENKVGYGRFKMHAQCVFPARVIFLQKMGLLQKQHVVECSDFEQWKQGMGTQAVDLVFSSYYPNNPASLFGHTFLRFHRGTVKNNLLDYGAAYAAMVPPDVGAIGYTFKGLLGGFYGFFNFEPYYQMVKHYNSFENRDLYEYQLNLTQEEIDILLGHLWELYSTGNSPYYFLTNNCSYMLAEVLEVAQPSWDLTEGNFIYYHPARTLLNLEKISHSISKIEYRPSLNKRYIAEAQNLTGEQQQELALLREGRKQLTEVRDPYVINSLVNYYNLVKHQKKLNISNEFQNKFQRILRYRAKLGLLPEHRIRFKRSFPERSHGYSRIAVGATSNKDRLQLRYGLCSLDHLGSDIGLPPDTKLISGDVTLTVDSKRRVELDQLIFMQMESLQLYSDYWPKFSWTLSGIYNSIDTSDNHQFELVGGAGYSVGQEDRLVSLLAGIYSAFSKKLYKGRRVGGFVKSIFIFDPVGAYKLVVDFRRIFLARSNSFNELNVGHSYSWKSGHELTLKSLYHFKIWQTQIQYSYYF